MIARSYSGFVPALDSTSGEPWAGRVPVTSVDWRGACAYAEWVARTEGRPWRLLHDLEWEKAARGVDGRVYPWGDHFEAEWANTGQSLGKIAHPLPVGTIPEDESVYGVADTAGNVRELCLNGYLPPSAWATGTRVEIRTPAPDEKLRMGRGGSCILTASVCRLAARATASADAAFTTVGFRIARSIR